MTNRTLQKLLALCLLTCLAAFTALAQDYKALLGKWNMTSETDGDSVQWTLILKDTDGKLSASIAVGNDEAPVKNFSYTDGVLKFTVPYEGEEYGIELKADGERLTGTWSGNGDSGRTGGTKAAAKN